MYLIQIDHRVFERKGGGGFGLVEALRELYGVRGAAVLRLDGTVAVSHAGSASAVGHVKRNGTTRNIRRRMTRRAARTFETQQRMAA